MPSLEDLCGTDIFKERGDPRNVLILVDHMCFVFRHACLGLMLMSGVAWETQYTKILVPGSIVRVVMWSRFDS